MRRLWPRSPPRRSALRVERSRKSWSPSVDRCKFAGGFSIDYCGFQKPDSRGRIGVRITANSTKPPIRCRKPSIRNPQSEISRRVFLASIPLLSVSTAAGSGGEILQALKTDDVERLKLDF